jgi:hypothetical protein
VAFKNEEGAISPDSGMLFEFYAVSGWNHFTYSYFNKNLTWTSQDQTSADKSNKRNNRITQPQRGVIFGVPGM